jgi:hypothetical protein
MNQELSTINVWLAILALVSLAEFLMIVAAGIVGFRLYRKTTALLDRAETTYVAPLAARAHVVVAEAQGVVRRAQHLEERVRGMVTRVEDMGGRVSAVAQHAWPVLGTWRAVSAALHAFRGNGEAHDEGYASAAFAGESGAGRRGR